jgi:hypothetical protein
MVRLGSEEEMMELEGVLSNNFSRDDRPPQLEPPQVRGKVDAAIHEWFTDLWLLITGEEMREEATYTRLKDGHPLAMFCGGQLRLLESKLSARNMLRSVGVEMY